MNTYNEYIRQVIAEFGVDQIKVPNGTEALFEGIGVSIESDSSTTLSDNRVVEFYASGILVARAKLP